MADGSPPKFEPWERFMLLSHAVEEMIIPPARAAEVLPHVTSAAMVVVRQLMGSKTRAEAYFAIERACSAAETARRGR